MPKKFPAEVRERAVRITLDRLADYPTVSPRESPPAPKLVIGVETLQK